MPTRFYVCLASLLVLSSTLVLGCSDKKASAQYQRSKDRHCNPEPWINPEREQEWIARSSEPHGVRATFTIEGKREFEEGTEFRDVKLVARYKHGDHMLTVSKGIKPGRVFVGRKTGSTFYIIFEDKDIELLLNNIAAQKALVDDKTADLKAKFREKLDNDDPTLNPRSTK